MTFEGLPEKEELPDDYEPPTEEEEREILLDLLGNDEFDRYTTKAQINLVFGILAGLAAKVKRRSDHPDAEDLPVYRFDVDDAEVEDEDLVELLFRYRRAIMEVDPNNGRPIIFDFQPDIGPGATGFAEYDPDDPEEGR